ncbi:MAG: LacI family DNA-binding transcriptional regulator [Acidobacteria bacterium]|nr:LacI family DNA-binding transcriptional regulator [Acidobacteriota bacterium]
MQELQRGPAMRDVAAAAGVSAQTVSRVLSGHPHVQDSTRTAVLAKVAELGYRRNNTARALVTGRSHTIGVVTLATNNYSRSTLALGIDLAARDAGYAVNSMTAAGLNVPSLKDAANRLVVQGVDGLIMAAPLLNAADAIAELAGPIPMVSTDASSPTSTDIVGVNQVAAVRLATEHLLQLGHQTVWQVSGPPEWSDAASRLTAWRTVLEASGREVPPELVGDWSPESGYKNGLILGRMPDVTAILVASDEMAFGVLRALAELGRRVPEDVSVVGIDDIDLAAYSTPPLTTVRQSFEDTGRRAVVHLLRQIEHPKAHPVPELTLPQLIVRGSTAPRRQPV